MTAPRVLGLPWDLVAAGDQIRARLAELRAETPPEVVAVVEAAAGVVRRGVHARAVSAGLSIDEVRRRFLVDASASLPADVAERGWGVVGLEHVVFALALWGDGA